MQYLFIYRDIVVGGCELLMGRIGKRLVDNGVAVKIICESIDMQMECKYKDDGIEIIKTSEWKKDIILSSLRCNEDESRIITFKWEDFVAFYKIDKKSKTILYVIHMKALTIAKRKKRWERKLLNIPIKKTIWKLSKSGYIIYMDEQTIHYTENYFNSFDLHGKIIRISVIPECFNEEYLKRKSEKMKMNILSIARADFPFKGYLIGLVKWFATTTLVANITLTIVSYGKDIEALKKEIYNLPLEKRNKIKLIGKTDYNKLNEYFKNANIYIGMGTTILDAALNGLISVPVLPYTYELVVDKFFHEDYRKLALETDNNKDFSTMIKYIASIDSNKYSELSVLSRQLVLDHYSNDVIVGQIINHFNNLSINPANTIISIFKKRYSLRE